MKIQFSVILNKIASLIDGGWRVSFDANQTEIDEIMLLSKHRDIVLKLAVEIEDDAQKNQDEFGISFDNSFK